MKNNNTPVILRTWKGKDCEIFALFPTIASFVSNDLCLSYQHIGQHSSADYHHCMKHSNPARHAGEMNNLRHELERIGYTNMNFYLRAQPWMHHQRKATP